MIDERSQQAREALAALRADLPGEAEQQRMRARLAAAGVAVGGAIASGTLASGAAASSSVVAGKSVAGSAGVFAKLASLPLAIKATAVAVVIAGTASAPLLAPKPQRTETPSAPRVQPVSPRASAPVKAPAMQITDIPGTSADTPIEPTRVEEPGAAPEQTPRTPRARGAVASGPAPDVSSASRLARESALLHDAIRALRAGDRDAAQSFLDEHARTFGRDAALAHERERILRELAAQAP